MNASKIYLVQTDTTVGFSSLDVEKLSVIKQRPKNQKILHTVESFKTLQQKTRVPKKHRRRVRRLNQSTFIYPNLESYRVIDTNNHFHSFLKRFQCLSSTSANKTAHKFEYDFATINSDIIVETKDGFFETNASSLYKLSKKRIKKLR